MVEPTKKPRRIIWAGLTTLTLAFVWAIATNAYPALRGPEDWRWTYAIPGQPGRHLFGAAAVIGYVTITFSWGGRLAGKSDGEPSRRAIFGYLLFCVLAAAVIQITLLAGESRDVVEQLYFRTVSAGSSGFFSVGSIIDSAGDFLAHYPELMPTRPVHPQRYPPGIPLLFYASRVPLAVGGLGEAIGASLRPYQCTDLVLMRIPNDIMGTAALQMLLPVFSSVVVFPLFGLARRTSGWDTAVWSAALYPLIPSFALWAGRWDQIFPLLTVTAWYLLVVGLTERRHGVIVASGVVLALASMLSFGLLVMLAPMGLWALLWLADRRTDWRWQQVVSAGFFFVTGLVLVWGIYEVIAGPGFLDIWRVAMGYHLGLERSYWTWLGYHLYDFGVFLGLPIALLCLFAFFYALLAMLRVQREVVALPIAFGLGMLALDISGMARGEVARVWIFLTPFAVVCAAWGLTRLARDRWPAGLLLVLVGIQLLTFNAFLRVVSTGITAVPPRTHAYTRPPSAQGLSARIGDKIHLIGYEVAPERVAAGESVLVTLYWQAEARIPVAYSVFNHVRDESGQIVGQQDGMPVNNSLPTTCWLPGEVITDAYSIEIEPGVAPGAYLLFSGLYHPETGERVPVTNVDHSAADAVLIDSIAVVGP